MRSATVLPQVLSTAARIQAVFTSVSIIIIIFNRIKMQHTIKKYNTMQKLITKKPKLKDNIKKKTEKTMCMSQHTSEQTCEAYEQCIIQHSEDQ